MNTLERTYFLPYQIAWIRDQSRLKIIEKSRQIGITYADAFDSVKKMTAERPLDVWVSSRDDLTAREYLNVCKEWALILNIAAQDLGERLIDSKKNLKAQVLEFSCGKRIYALSSNPNAIVGKKGHIKLDEFAVRPAQRDLYRWSKPATTWGGTLSIISTHRGTQSVFYEIIRGIRERGNPMGWSHHRVDIHDAVRAGLVEKINEKTGENLSREDFIHRCRAECIDEEQWLQEYCCVPTDDSAAFITHEMISGCEHSDCLKPFHYLQSCPNYLYVGVDVARKKHLCVIDIGEKIGDVIWDRYRVELQNKTFSEIRHELYRVLRLPKVLRCCIDNTGLGMQLAEEAEQTFGSKVETITFNLGVKEELAFHLRNCFDDRILRIDPSPELRSDLRGVRKETTAAGKTRFVAESDDGHCDRFWAKALRQHAAKQKREVFAIVID